MDAVGIWREYPLCLFLGNEEGREKKGKLNCRLNLYQLLSAVQTEENEVLFRCLRCAWDDVYGEIINIR